MINRVASTSEGVISPSRLVDACLDVLGVVTVSDGTRETLENFAVQGGELKVNPDSVDDAAQQRIAQLFQMVAASHEFQRS